MGKRRHKSTSESETSSEEETRRLRRKLRKYKRRYERQREISATRSSSDSDKENGVVGEGPLGNEESSSERGEIFSSPTRIFLPEIQANNGDQPTENDADDPLSLEGAAPLNKDILKLLGNEDSVKEKISENIHSDLAMRWNLILKNGLEDGIRSEIINKYPPVKNCLLMAAPKLNMEVKAAISETNLKRDERLAKVQSQVGSCLSALGRALTIVFDEKEVHDVLKMKLIEVMSDSARLLADVHYQETRTRRNILSLSLKKDLNHTWSDAAVDGWLFGENLGERVKAAKAIEQSGKELRNSDNKQNKRRNNPTKGPLNSKGPSRRVGLNHRLGGQRYADQKRGGGSRSYPEYRPSRISRERPRTRLPK